MPTFCQHNLLLICFGWQSPPSFCILSHDFLGLPYLLKTTAQIGDKVSEASRNAIVSTKNTGIVQMASGQFPKVLFLTTLSNHYDILCRCRSFEERLFYILYAHKEKLSNKELQRAITTQTYEALLSDKKNMSKGLLEIYPNSPIMFKDTYFVDFLNLPKKHSENKLTDGEKQSGIDRINRATLLNTNITQGVTLG